jgi:hypothetical protein
MGSGQIGSTVLGSGLLGELPVHSGEPCDMLPAAPMQASLSNRNLLYSTSSSTGPAHLPLMARWFRGTPARLCWPDL